MTQLFVGMVLAAGVLGSPPAPCAGPGADPWVTDFRDRVVAYSSLAAWAAERFGPPTRCEGERTDEFDGAVYGVLRLGFAAGVTLEAETMPIETSVTTLRAPDGFPDEAAARTALREDAERVGLRIDWTSPEITTAGGERTERYRDPDPGLNAAASLVWAGDRLVEIGVSMAL